MKIFNFLLLFMFVSCAGVIKNQDTEGMKFPQVIGTSLSGIKTQIPLDLGRDFQLLLIGYKQKSQFDIDRWLIGLEMAEAKIMINELPVLGSWFPTFLRKKIDGGMKNGIPSGLWKNVITVYDDAEIIKKFLGTENPNNARVILLGPDKKVVLHFDDGFSTKSLMKMLSFLPTNKKNKCAK